METINKVISIILSIILGITMLLGNILLVVKNSVNIDNVTKLISDNIFTYVDVNYGSSNVVRTNLNVDVDSYLNEYGIDKEVLNDLIKNEEFKNVIEKYKNNVNDYLIGKEEINLDNEEINKVIDSVIEDYENRTGKDIDTDKFKGEINKAIDEINNNLSSVKIDKSISKFLSFILDGTIIYILIVINLVLALAIFLVNSNNIFRTLKYISVPSITVGIILLLLGVIANIVDIDIINSIIKSMSNNFYINGLINLVLGIIMLIIGLFNCKEKSIDI